MGKTKLRVSMSEAAAQYKKTDGRLVVSQDGRSVSWTANSGNPRLDIAVADIGSKYRVVVGESLVPCMPSC